jgi:hypothetical protein
MHQSMGYTSHPSVFSLLADICSSDAQGSLCRSIIHRVKRLIRPPHGGARLRDPMVLACITWNWVEAL